MDESASQSNPQPDPRVQERILKQLYEKGDMDGYALVKIARVNPDDLRLAIEPLVDAGKVKFRGNLRENALEAWYTVRHYPA